MGKTENPIERFTRLQGVMILDGGLATALESHGCDLKDDLWSARVLLEAPSVIQEVYRQYLESGADCIATATYQATFPGFRKRGLTEDQAEEALLLSVRLAVEARDSFWRASDDPLRIRPIVVASIGPYGAYLADGSEYTGRYGISDSDLDRFHRRRWKVLAESDVDMMACETIPSRQETRILLRLLRETPGRWAWLSCSCRDETRLSDGSRIADVARDCESEPQVAAIGINCTPPRLISKLVREVRTETEKPIVVYPNSGELYASGEKVWTGAVARLDWEQAASEWMDLGVAAIGGCCRIGPSEIAELRDSVLKDKGR